MVMNSNEEYPGSGYGEEDIPRMEGEDLEIDNRIKELLLSTHNLYLIGQMHEKEINELGPVIKDLPQMINGVLRTVGELGGGEGSQQAGGGSGKISLLAAVMMCGGTSIVTSLLTVALIKAMMGS